MNTRSNWWILAAALGLAVYVWFVDRRAGVRVSGPGGATATFAPIPMEEVIGLELNVSNRVMAIQRSAPGAPWKFRLPLETDVDPARVQTMLQLLGRLQPTSYVGLAEFTAAGGARTHGLDVASGIRLGIVLRDGKPVTLQLGALTLDGTRFYLQRVGDPGVFVADRALLDAVPAMPDDWRDRALFVAPREGFDRVEVKGAAEFRAELDGAGNWRLKRPLDARADSERIHTLIALLRQVRVDRFVSDRPVADLESYGLQSPAAEVVLGRGAQDLVQLSVGAVVTNDPAHRYALRRNSTSLVTVPSRILEPLSQPLPEYRDRRLLGDVAAATALEFVGGPGDAGFRVERTNAASTIWWVTAPRRFPADPGVMDFFLRQFGHFEIADFTADIVPDPARYGLAPPVRSYRLLSGTNLMAELQFGTLMTNRPALLHVRRTDEPSVYGLPTSITGQLAQVAGQLRDWRFVATNAVRLRVRRDAREGVLTRTNGGWNTAGGRLDSIGAGNLEATLNGLGSLRSDRFALSDAAQEQLFRKTFRLAESPLTLTVELGPGGSAGFTRWTLEFGGVLGASRVALVRFDDDPVPLRVQVPLILFEDLMRDLVL